MTWGRIDGLCGRQQFGELASSDRGSVGNRGHFRSMSERSESTKGRCEKIGGRRRKSQSIALQRHVAVPKLGQPSSNDVVSNKPLRWKEGLLTKSTQTSVSMGADRDDFPVVRTDRLRRVKRLSYVIDKSFLVSVY